MMSNNDNDKNDYNNNSFGQMPFLKPPVTYKGLSINQTQIARVTESTSITKPNLGKKQAVKPSSFSGKYHMSTNEYCIINKYCKNCNCRYYFMKKRNALMHDLKTLHKWDRNNGLLETFKSQLKKFTLCHAFN